MQIHNQTRGTLIADTVELAHSFLARGRGLMGRPSLPEGFAMVIYPEWSIHTFFMRVPIDVLFVDKTHTVIGLQHRMPPNRPYAGVSPMKGQYVIELPGGVLQATGTQAGDRLVFDPPIP